jgi:AcrR family transcriptional regulator
MPPTARHYRGVHPDQRRSERRARLVTACLELLGGDGVSAVSAESVAARAGLTKRYFYESFTDRDALLEELLSEFFALIYSTIEAALSAAPPSAEARAHTIAASLVDELAHDPQRARLYIEAPGIPRLQARLEQAYELFTQLVLNNFPFENNRQSDRSDSEMMERQKFSALLIVAGTTQAVITWLRGNIQLSRRDIVDELARIIVGALPSSAS